MTERPLLERWFPSGTRLGFPVMAGALPGLGHTLSVYLDVVGALRRARAELGPIFWLNLGLNKWYLFCTGKGSFELLKHPAVVNAGSRTSLIYLLGKSLLTIDGAEHRRIRSTMNPSFLPRGMMENGSGAIIADVVQQRIQHWVKNPLKIHDETREIALDVVFRLTGVGQQDLTDWRRQYGELLLGLLPPPWDLPFSPRRRALKAATWINSRITNLVESARIDSTGVSMTHTLARARDEEGKPLSTEELVDNIRLLFLAGHETTASTTAWAILELATRPDQWEKLIAETADRKPIPATMAEAREFPFCEAVFRESVRMYGPAWFIERRTTEDLEHEGRPIPAGSIIALPPSVWSRDETLYPEPDTFNPDRWLSRPAPTPVEMSQFGGGAHFCLGYHLAWLEAVTLLVALGKEMGTRGLRPRLLSKDPLIQRYLPLPHPPSSARVSFEKP